MPPHLPQNLKPYVTSAVFMFLLIYYANRSLNLGILTVRVWMQEVQRQILKFTELACTA